jgi:KDO2-lipid IV(A) lauroyltransferase
VDGYTLVIEPPLADFPTADARADAARMNAVIESSAGRPLPWLAAA